MLFPTGRDFLPSASQAFTPGSGNWNLGLLGLFFWAFWAFSISVPHLKPGSCQHCFILRVFHVFRVLGDRHQARHHQQGALQRRPGAAEPVRAGNPHTRGHTPHHRDHPGMAQTPQGAVGFGPLSALLRPLQRCIDWNRDILKKELGLLEEDIIDLPALFKLDKQGKAVPYFPNTVRVGFPSLGGFPPSGPPQKTTQSARMSPQSFPGKIKSTQV